MFAPVSERSRKIPRRTSGLGLRVSTATKAASRASAPRSRPIVPAAVQPQLSAFVIPKTRSARPDVTVAAPRKSKWRTAFSCRLSGISRSEPRSATTPIGRLTKKIQRQSSHSVSIPPNRRPKAPPATAIAAQTESARVRSWPSRNVVVTIERAAGDTSAAPKPCTARKAMSIVAGLGKPATSDARTKTTIPARKRRRRPSRSDIRPPRSRKPPNESE